MDSYKHKKLNKYPLKPRLLIHDAAERKRANLHDTIPAVSGVYVSDWS